MRKFVLVGLTIAGLGLSALTPAAAQGGCGPFAHRGWNGACHPGGFGPGGFGHRPWGPGWGWHRHGWGWHRHW